MGNSQTVLITGTTTGIGRHAALFLANRGHTVIATGRKQALLDSLRTESGGKIHTVLLDVTNADSIATASQEVERITGGRGIDALVNNAGYGIAAPLVETPDAEVRGQFETNVFGLLAVTRAFVPAMMDRRHGTVVNISSVGGRTTLPFFGAYNATKYAVESMSDALRLELAPFGVRVAVVEPGSVKSEFANTSMQSVDRHKGAESRYAGAMAVADRIRENADASAVAPDVVSKAIAHAIESSRPCARYVAPASYSLVLALARTLPTRWVDALLSRFAGLTRRQLGLLAA